MIPLVLRLLHRENGCENDPPNGGAEPFASWADLVRIDLS